jgi:hypothetical protein
MDEVIGDVAAGELRHELIFVFQVGFDDLDAGLGSPGSGLKFSLVADEAAKGMSGVQEFGSEAAADVAGSAGEADFHGVTFLTSPGRQMMRAFWRVNSWKWISWKGILLNDSALELCKWLLNSRDIRRRWPSS